MSMSNWTEACKADDVDNEDVIPVEIDGHHYAVYRSPDDDYFATDGLCTHEAFLLADGLVMDNIIECPKHNGCFDLATGEAVRRPAVEPITLYDVEVRSGRVVSSLKPRSALIPNS